MTSQLEKLVSAFGETRKGKVWCLVVVTNDYHVPTFSVGIAVLGQPGYYALTPKITADDDYGKLSALVTDINTRVLGLDESTQIAIYADTMHRSEFRRNQEAGIGSIKVTLDDLKHIKEGLEEGFGLESAQDVPVYVRVCDEIDTWEATCA